VGLGLGGGERGKDGERATLGAITHLRAIDDGGDVRQGTVVMVVGVMVALVAMTVGLMVMLVAVTVLVVVMMVVLVLMHMLGSCFVAVEPGHVVVVVLELLCQLNVKVAGVDAVLVYACNGNRKASDRQRGELLAQVFLAGAQVEQGRDGHIAADARGAVDDKRVLMVRHGMLLNGRRVFRRSDD
jgi:hypothetical protein